MMATTPNRNYPLVVGSNELALDVLKLVALAGMVDADIQALFAALSGKADLSGAAFTASPTAPAPSSGDDSNKLATTAWVNAAFALGLANLVNGAPEALNALNELAAAMGNNPNFAADVAAQIGLKANAADVNAALVLKLAKDGGNLANDTERLALANTSKMLSFLGQSRSLAEQLQARRNIGAGWGIIDEFDLVGQSYIDVLNITGGYDFIRFTGWYTLSASVPLLLRLSDNNGTSFNSDPAHPWQYLLGSMSSPTSGNGNSAAMYLGVQNVNASSYMGLNAMLLGFNRNCQKLLQSIQTGAILGGNLGVSLSNSWSAGSDNGVMNALRIFPSSGVLSSGHIIVEGLKK